MNAETQKTLLEIFFWAVAVLFFGFCLYVLKSALLPFVLGFAVAYLLNPLVNGLGAWGMGRSYAAMLILLAFLFVFFGLIGVLSPILYREFVQFYHDFPQYSAKLMEMFAPVQVIIEKYVGSSAPQELEAILKQNSGAAMGIVQAVLLRVTSGGQALLDIISVIVFMPVVAYFTMKEWPAITAWVCALVPRHVEGVVMDLLREMDQKVSGFVRGQVMVALMMGLVYAVVLSLAGLKYGFLIGLGSGFLSIVPMVGSAVGLVISVALAWFQAGTLSFVAMIAGIFILGQVVEGNFLTPKLVGESVGLHPLWIFFALLAGGSLLGVMGMFLAVPVAAVMGVLLGFSVKQYKASEFYNKISRT